MDMTCKDCENLAIEIKPGDRIFYAIYDEVFPEESYVGSDKIFDVGTKGIYFNGEKGLAEFYSHDEIGKSIYLTKKEAENELLCMIARG